MCRLSRKIQNTSLTSVAKRGGRPSGAADEQPHAKRGGQWTSAAAATTATPIAAPPLPSLRHHLLCHRCAPSLRPIAAPPSLRCHHNRCAATASAVVTRPQQAHRSPNRPLMMPLPPEHLSMMPTQQSKEMNRKAQVVVERERGEVNDGDDDRDNNNIGKAEAVAKTTMTTTSDAHVGGGMINTTIKT
jgi:hypothetical protein